MARTNDVTVATAFGWAALNGVTISAVAWSSAELNTTNVK